MNDKSEKLIDKKGIRGDGRKADELRPVKLQVGVLSNADGSAYIEHGKNKILAAAFGPREMHPKHLAQPDRMVLRARYHMAPFSVPERKSPAPSRREVELSKVIKESLEPALFLELYPRTGVDVFVEVLQADGGTRCAAITAAALAIADAGVPMRDLVVACAAGKVDDTVVLDLYDAEDKLGLSRCSSCLHAKLKRCHPATDGRHLGTTRIRESSQHGYGRMQENLCNAEGSIKDKIHGC